MRPADAGVDDPAEATQIAGVDHAKALRTEARPPPTPGFARGSAISQRGVDRVALGVRDAVLQGRR